MEALKLTTEIGSFWLESNGVKLRFIIKSLEEGYSQNYDSEQDKVSLIKCLQPILTKEQQVAIKDIFLCSDVNQRGWSYDSFGSGQDLVHFSFLNEASLVALGIGASYGEDDYQEWFYPEMNRTGEAVCLPLDQVNQIEESIIFGYRNLNIDTINLCQFALSIRKYHTVTDLSSEAVDLAVFLSL